MAEAQPLDWEEMRRLTRAHLESLRAAGVEWLPAAPPLSSPHLAGASTQPALGIHRAKQSMPKQPASPNSGMFEPPASPARPDLSIEQRRQELTLLADRVKPCTRCGELAATRTQTVFGVGMIRPELCLIGEAPGADEDRLGEPFVGRAGQLLDKILQACGLRREEVYICNILKCRPPGNRTPLPNEAANCREYLDAQLALVQPRFLCALGACAAQNLLGTTVSIGRLRGQFHRYKDIPVLCTFHPSYLLRSPDKKRDAWEDFKMLMREMGRTIPQSSSGGA
jgi:DNA polymerase